MSKPMSRRMKSRERIRGAYWSVRERGRQIPLRWRLALVSFALLAVLLGGLGALISFTEEHALITNEAAALYNEGRLAASHVTSTDLLIQRLAGVNAGVMVL